LKRSDDLSVSIAKSSCRAGSMFLGMMKSAKKRGVPNDIVMFSPPMMLGCKSFNFIEDRHTGGTGVAVLAPPP
jgi:hypothetical protein